MSGELLVVNSSIERNRKMPRDVGIRQEAARTDLKIREICLEEIVQGKETLIDPCIVFCTHRDIHLTLERMFPNVRKITFTETDDNFKRVSTVRHDTYSMAYDLMEYLVGAGRKKVALFGFDRLSVYNRSTLTCFQNAAEMFCISLSMNDIFLNDSTLDVCMENFARQMHRYDAVVCVNDYAAIFLSGKLKARGVRVPEDLFIIGRGNAPVSSEVIPAVTTIDYMEETVGRETVSLYWYLLRHPEILRTDVLVKHKLIVRESTALAPIRKADSSVPLPEKVVLADRGYNELMQLEKVLTAGDAVNREILRMLESHTTEQIASALYMSESTVKYRIGNIAKILGVKGRKEICRILRLYPLLFMKNHEKLSINAKIKSK